ncbi:MAG: hypothetical protein ACK4P2_05885 [Hyphomonas sp.]
MTDEPGLVTALLGPSFDFAQDELWYALPMKEMRRWQGAARESVTLPAGVWRKFSGEIFQALDASTDFVSGGSGDCCTRRAAA